MITIDTKKTMSPKEAQDIVVRWLREGGKPNDDVGYRYSYQAPIARDGYACAAAAIGDLVYGEPVSAGNVGEYLYGDVTLFFSLDVKGADSDDPVQVAEYVAKLSPQNG
jgi:hypothetical protein